MPYSSFNLPATLSNSLVSMRLQGPATTWGSSDNPVLMPEVSNGPGTAVMYDWAQRTRVEEILDAMPGEMLLEPSNESDVLASSVATTQVDPFNHVGVWTQAALDLSSTSDRVPARLYSASSDNTLATARNIGSLSNQQTFRDFIGPSDPNDFYRFQLDHAGDFSLTLDNDNDWSNVRLLDESGNTITSTTAYLYTNGRINRYLAAGTYYVQVDDWVNDSTSYTLDLSAQLYPNDGAGSDNTLATARDIGSLEANQTFRDFIGPSDSNDFYRFHLDHAGDFSLRLDNDNDWSNVRLLDEYGNTITSRTAYLYTDGTINRYLAAGTYYVQVDDWVNDYTSYTLDLSAVLYPPVDGAGNSLSNALHVGQLSGTQSFNDFVGAGDAIDFYRFELNQSSNFSLNMSGLSDDIDVELLDSNGHSLTISQAPNSENEQITAQLGAGAYYVAVYPFLDSSSDYRLQLSAHPWGSPAPTPPTPTVPYSPNYGYGAVDANAALSYVLDQSPAPTVPNIGTLNWGLDAIQAPEVWNQGYTGEGVVVAVLDGGVDYTHSDLNDNIWRNTDEIAGNGIDDDGNGFVDDVLGWDFVDRDHAPMDYYWDGHGTHVAGIIAAENGGFSTTGVAYNTEIMPVRVLGNDGSGSYADIISGIYYAVNNGADIINMSLGGSTPNSNLEAAIQYANSRGVLMIFAAGNNGTTTPFYPAHYATNYGIAVGAINESGNLRNFSNRPGNNPELDFVVAPGGSIYSTEPGEWTGFQSGTSMAAPMVSGVAALLLSADPTLTPDELRAALTQTAVPLA